MNLLPVLEGLLFLVGDEGIEPNRLKDILEIDEKELNLLLEKLAKSYDENRGLKLEYLGGKYKLTTKKEHKEYYEKLTELEDSKTLSPAALETLVIIAYNQPITRAQVDEMRGVSSQHIIRRLVARNLVKASGKSTLPGRPNLYETTSDFLDYFGLSTINDLPKIDESEETNTEETELFTSIYKEDVEK